MPKKTVVGLDVGTNNLRAVEALPTPNGPKIIGAASIAIPKGCVVGGTVTDKQAFSTALKELWAVGKFSTREVRVVTNSESNRASLEVFDDEIDFARVLPFTLKSEHNVDTSNLYISFHTLRKFEETVEDRSSTDKVRVVPKREIFLATTERAGVDTLIEAFTMARLRVISLDIAPLAIIRGDHDPSYSGHPEGINTHVNIGGDLTTVVITHQGQPAFVRVVGNGGSNITNAISEQLSVSEDEAEALKIRTLTMSPKLLKLDTLMGTVFGSDEDEPSDEGTEQYSMNETDAYDIVNEELMDIIDEITSTVLYFVDRNSRGLGRIKNRTYISGGTASFGKIRTHLIHEIGSESTINSQPFNIMSKMGLMDTGLAQQLSDVQHHYTIAVGAIRGTGGESL